MGMDTAKTDLSFHSALEALVIFELGSLSHKEKVCKLYVEVGRKFWLHLFAIAKAASLKGKTYTCFVET